MPTCIFPRSATAKNVCCEATAYPQPVVTWTVSLYAFCLHRCYQRHLGFAFILSFALAPASASSPGPPSYFFRLGPIPFTRRPTRLLSTTTKTYCTVGKLLYSRQHSCMIEKVTLRLVALFFNEARLIVRGVEHIL
jgi:hypothetical protein